MRNRRIAFARSLKIFSYTTQPYKNILARYRGRTRFEDRSHATTALNSKYTTLLFTHSKKSIVQYQLQQTCSRDKLFSLRTLLNLRSRSRRGTRRCLLRSDKYKSTLLRVWRWPALKFTRQLRLNYEPKETFRKRFLDDARSNSEFTNKTRSDTSIFGEEFWNQYLFVKNKDALEKDQAQAHIVPVSAGGYSLDARAISGEFDVIGAWLHEMTILRFCLNKPTYVADTFFLRLRDSRRFRYLLYVSDDTRTRVSNESAPIDFTRANSYFVNRFSRHGKQRKAAKAFAKALAMLSFFYKESALEHSQLTDVFYSLCVLKKLFLFSEIDSVVSAPSIILNSLHTRLGVQDKHTSFLNTHVSGQYFLQKLWSIAPIYMLLPKRIDKQRYKNSRGKSGRYEMSLIRVTARNRLSVGLRALKYDWAFYGDRGYDARFFRIMQLLVFNVEQTWCYKLSERALLKVSERF